MWIQVGDKDAVKRRKRGRDPVKGKCGKLAWALALTFLTACASAAPSSAAPELVPPAESAVEQPAVGYVVAGPLTFYDLKEGSANETGYYQILANPAGAHVLARTDFASGQRRILCDRSGCGHADARCPAFVDCPAGQPRLVAQQDRLVLIHPRRPALGQTPAVPARVEVRGTDGGDSRTVCAFAPDEDPGLYFAADRDSLYALVSTAASGGGTRSRRLARVHLDSGVLETLAQLDHPQDNVMIQGVFENHVLLKRIFEGGTSRQLPVEDWDSKINSQIHSLFFLDDRGQEQTLVQWRQYQAAGFVFDGACYLFYDNGELHKADFATGTGTVLAAFGPQWGKDFAQCTAKIGDALVVDLYPRDMLPGQGTAVRFAVDTEQGGSVTLPQQTLWQGWQQPVPIVYADDQRVLALWGTRPAAGTDWEQTNGQRPVWGLLSAADFLAGSRNYTELAPIA